MLCCKCKKREAVVFISRVEDGQTINEGYCMICARELGMSQINSLLDKVKDSQNKDNEKYIADLNEQFKEMLGEDGEKFVNPESMAMMGNMMKSIMGLTKDFGDGKIPQFDIKFDLGGLNPESVGEENSQETEENISPDGSENSGKSKRNHP